MFKINQSSIHQKCLVEYDDVPVVMVLESDSGLPMATTHSPGRRVEEVPSRMMGRFPHGILKFNISNYTKVIIDDPHQYTCRSRPALRVSDSGFNPL